ncbi:acyl-CoA dehydrogenase [Kribbella deserti]|uniref:Acyl-CoA dehydrogenase n=1 Tax=Kribbella deserti TaxID=1926257 RepID=A0ABV6QIV1_9ACTN
MADDLESLLGDARDTANPVGTCQVLRADERGELLAAGEELLTRSGFNAEFVPARLGGRLTTADRLVRAVRPVFRRDTSLGLGYGITSLMAAVNVWCAGTPAQQRHVGGLLMSGERLSVAYHELEHGNDFSRNEFVARPDAGQLRLTGVKQVINNISRAAAFVLFARTGEGGGPRAYSLLLIERDQVDGSGLAYLPRTRTSGVRGVQLGGVRAVDHPVPATTLLGAAGGGVETALRSFQVTRAVLPGLAVGSVDTALRTVLRFAASRHLYGGTVLDLPHARQVIAGAFTDLLIVDALAAAACRGLHVLPAQSSVHSAAAKYLSAHLLTKAMDDLAVVLGARYYLRQGDHAIFGKHLRDLPVVSIGHASEATCLLTIVPQLPALGRHAWQDPAPPPPSLFDTAQTLPPLDLGRLALSAGGRDDLAGLLVAGQTQDNQLDGDLGSLRVQLHTLATDSAAIPPPERGPLAGPQTFALARRYTLLLAAAAGLGFWQTAQTRGNPFAGDPRWLAAVLTRLRGHLGGHTEALPTDVTDWLLRELIRRERDGISFDLNETTVLT